MTLTEQDVKKIAHLSRLQFEENSIHQVTDKLENILQLIEKMSQLDTTQVEPLAHPLNTTQSLRPDQITELDQRDLFMQNAPKSLMGLFIVPAVIEAE